MLNIKLSMSSERQLLLFQIKYVYYKNIFF